MKQFLLVSTFFLFVGLFVGGASCFDNRIARELWESGHFLLFFFASFYLYTYSRLSRIREIKRSVIILGILVVAGLLTELMQLSVGRNFEMKDLLNDLLGILAGLLIPHLRFKADLRRSVLFLLLFVSLTTFSFKPLLSTVVQEVRLRQEFPILSDFETASQLERWQDNQARLSISDSKVRDGRFSMRAELFPGKYPGMALRHLHGNWQGYQFIELSIYLDAKYSVNLAMKVYDRQHPKSGYDYNDRFNGNLSLNPGWNDFSLSLHSIQNAPTGRSMDMEKIASLSFFTVNLQQDITLYIDNVQLVSKF